MIAYCLNNLFQIKALTTNICNDNYSKPCQQLFNSSIGQHIRHALEFYSCLFNGLESGVVNYDERKRQYELENDTNSVNALIEKIENQLKSFNTNIPLEIKANYTEDSDEDVTMQSSLYRELGFCLEHSIHHLALVKTGLKELNCLELIDKNFGVAPSTLRHQKQCVQ
jgi:uncharacterized damage-inducible protein DinB